MTLVSAPNVSIKGFMNLKVELPDTIAHRLQLDGPDAEVRAREIFALQEYEFGQLPRRQVGDLLQLSFYENEV
jgi:hypothetical protein